MQRTFPDKDDRELLELFRASGNSEYLGVLLERYTGLLLGVCLKYLRDREAARDAVQQIFVKAITELRRYEVQYFKSWLYMVAKNHCLMQLRDKKGRTQEIIESLLPAADSAIDAKQKAEADQTDLLNLAVAIEGLGREQAVCITLFYLHKKTYREIAEQTDFSEMQVKSHIQNGKRNLKIVMEKNRAANE